jgi:hypothetical protein
MKTIKMKTLATGIVAAMILFTGCTKKGDTGPAGAQGATGVVTTSTDGFIKGTLTGTRRDGTTFSEAFNYQNYWGGPSGTLDSMGVGMFGFSINRGTDILSNNSISLSINTISPTSTTASYVSMSFSFTKSLGTNKEFYFSQSGGGTTTVNTLSYNKTTGLFTGNFSTSLTASQNNTGKAASIVGSFQATITQLVYLKKHTGININ